MEAECELGKDGDFGSWRGLPGSWWSLERSLRWAGGEEVSAHARSRELEVVRFACFGIFD